MSYRAIVDNIEVPEATTRDTEAVKRIATAYLKLLFPNVRKRRLLLVNLNDTVLRARKWGNIKYQLYPWRRISG